MNSFKKKLLQKQDIRKIDFLIGFILFIIILLLLKIFDPGPYSNVAIGFSCSITIILVMLYREIRKKK